MTSFNFDVITLFPKAFESINNLGVMTRALDKNLINVNLHDLREYGKGSYRQVDDKPYGGGSGMVLKPEPIYKAHDSISKLPNSKTLLMTPQGKVMKQQDLLRWSSLDQLIIICGQYEGFDERVRCLADEEISIGDYVLSGGEKVRCMLSKIMMGKPNVLLIDEPTNHLDLESITAFNNSLSNFKGTVLLSTNDRAFAESVANRIIEITPNGIIDSYLPFSEYIVDEKVLSQREKLYS